MKLSPYLIAEIGGNHQGSEERLWQITELAIKSKPNCIKYQLYTGDSLVNPKHDKKRNIHFKGFELNNAIYKQISKRLKKENIDFAASFWSYELYEDFSDHVSFIKVGSGDLTNYPLLKAFAKSNKKLIISTGLSNYNEIEDMVKFIKNENPYYLKKENICILQCTSMYPIDNSEANVSIMNTFKKFDVEIGYSDHTIGCEALYIAALKGASILEFHFTDNKNDSTFRDHQISLDYKDVINLKNKISEANNILGSSIKTPTKSEINSGHINSFRRGIYASRPISKGKKISMDDLVFLRPELTLNHSAKNFQKLIGSVTKENYNKYDPIL